MPLPIHGLHPSIDLASDIEKGRLISDAEWNRDEFIGMAVDSCEDDWSRLHDMKLNGNILEYTGRGKGVVDVGLAQAHWPLDTTYHYFEIEIIDPGEHCYIAIGLASREYPRHRHPGWNMGSIAYHADDGKVFAESGVGLPFGPRCHKGDIMGCGILFPSDYCPEQNLDVSPSDTPDVQEGPREPPQLQHLSSWESEGEEEWKSDGAPNGGWTSDEDDECLGYLDGVEEREAWHDQEKAKRDMDTGHKVNIFFTRNSKVIGQREIGLPKGGFYPTVGMLSTDEKVRVELRPLTG